MKKVFYITLFTLLVITITGTVYINKLNNQASATEIKLNADKLWDIVQNWRKSQGLNQYEKNDFLCSIANERSYIPDDNHQGFINKYGNSPFILSENYSFAYSEEQVLYGWRHSPAHLKALKTPYKYSCVACHLNKCVQIFSNL